MMHLSRFCEEIILWSSHEFRFIELDDAYATGSSIMPQKKNPDMAELIRGKTGRVYGHLMGLLTTLKGLPLAYNKDMQEDKEALFDAIDTVKMCLPVFTNMIATMTVKKDNMLQAAKGGFTNATDAADWLVKQGVPFRDAHSIIGHLVHRTQHQSGRPFSGRISGNFPCIQRKRVRCHQRKTVRGSKKRHWRPFQSHDHKGYCR